jgi:hypothetical protein
MLETDGPYGGGSCAATNHAHHAGWDDSIYQQEQKQYQFYHRMRELNVFVCCYSNHTVHQVTSLSLR